MLQKNYMLNIVHLNFLFIKESWKSYNGFHTNIKQHNIFSIDNNKKCFLISKSAYYDFWRIMWHWRPDQKHMHSLFLRGVGGGGGVHAQ